MKTKISYTLLLLRTGIGNVIISSLEYDKNAFQRLKTILATSDGYNSTPLLLRTGIGNVIISSLEYDKNAFQR